MDYNTYSEMTGETKKEQVCTKCGATFSYLGNRLRHEQTCKGEYNQKCLLCSAHFRSKYSLKNHLKMCIARQELALNSKSMSTPDDVLKSVKELKKWKFCFYDSCYCTFYQYAHLILHLYSQHPNLLKYGMQLYEFENMETFEAWRLSECERTKSCYVIRSRKENNVTFMCWDGALEEVLHKLDNRVLKGVSRKRLCSSRIILVPHKDKYICAYLDFHTHNLKFESLKSHTEDKDLYNKLKSYICLGVEVDEIYKQLVAVSGNADVSNFRKQYTEVKDSVEELKLRMLTEKLSNQEINSDESDDDENEEICENIVELPDNVTAEYEIPMQDDKLYIMESAEVEGEESTNFHVVIKPGEDVMNEHLYCQVPGVQVEIEDGILPELQQFPAIKVESMNEQTAVPKIQSKFNIKKREIKSFAIRKRKAEESLVNSMFATGEPEDPQPANLIKEEKIKTFLLEKKKADDELVKKLFSKRSRNIIEEALKISDILPPNDTENVPPEAVAEPPKIDKPPDKNIENNVKIIQSKEPDRPKLPPKETIELIKKNMALMDKYLENPLISDEETYFINDAIDQVIKKCKMQIHKPSFTATQKNFHRDATKVILKYLNYTNLQHNVLYLDKNRILVPLVDLFTLLSPTLSDYIIDILKNADHKFEKSHLTKCVIDAYFYRLSLENENSKLYLFGNCSLVEELKTSSDVESLVLKDIFSEANLKDKTHLFLPYIINQNHWILLVFHIKFHFYGILNPAAFMDLKQCTELKTIIGNIKRILPKGPWRNMEYKRVFQVYKADSGVFICYYLERLIKKLPLVEAVQAVTYRLNIFNVIKGNCLGQAQFDHKKCAICKLHIISKNDKVSCKECKISFHLICVGLSTDKENYICPDYQ